MWLNVPALITWNNDYYYAYQQNYPHDIDVYIIFLATCKINYTLHYMYACGFLWLPSNTTGTRVLCIRYAAEMTKINAIGLGRQ